MGLGDDVRNADESQSFGVMPKMRYLATIKDCKLAPNKNSAGSHLKVTFEMNGPKKYERRLHWENLTWENANDTAQSIGRGKIKNLLRSVGFADLNNPKYASLAGKCKDLSEFQDWGQLVGKQTVMKLGVKKGADGAEENRADEWFEPNNANIDLMQKEWDQALMLAEKGADIPF